MSTIAVATCSNCARAMVVLAGEGRSSSFNKHLLVILLGCLILLGRDFANKWQQTGQEEEGNTKGADIPKPKEHAEEIQPPTSSPLDAQGRKDKDLVVDESLEVPEGSMRFLDSYNSGKSMQRTFMEQHSQGHKVHISFCSS